MRNFRQAQSSSRFRVQVRPSGTSSLAFHVRAQLVERPDLAEWNWRRACLSESATECTAAAAMAGCGRRCRKCMKLLPPVPRRRHVDSFAAGAASLSLERVSQRQPASSSRLAPAPSISARPRPLQPSGIPPPSPARTNGHRKRSGRSRSPQHPHWPSVAADAGWPRHGPSAANPFLDLTTRPRAPCACHGAVARRTRQSVHSSPVACLLPRASRESLICPRPPEQIS